MINQNSKTKYTNDLGTLFSSYSTKEGIVGEVASRGYAACEPEEKKLLCIGINPSYLAGHKPESFIYPLEDALKESHYKSFEEIAKNGHLSGRWGYLDLLCLREKTQKEIHALMKATSGLDFICAQLKISQALVEALNPKIILIANADARRFFGVDQEQVENGEAKQIWMGYQLVFDEEFGVYVIQGIHSANLLGIQSTSLVGVPVLFTGALTYIETKSKERLSWYLRKIVKNYDSYFGESYQDRNNRELLISITGNLVNELDKLIETKQKLAQTGKYEQVVKSFDKEKHLLAALNKLLIKLRD